jgi:protein gp37
MGQPKYQNDGDRRTSGPGFGLTLHPESLGIPARWTTPRTIFVNSMSDLFHPEVPLDFIREVFGVIEDTPRHTYQILTKRSQRLKAVSNKLQWPRNLWLGVSIETDRYCFRADHLRTVPASVRFLSLEPLLGPLPSLNLEHIGWVIVGGESGPRSRCIEVDWIREIRDRCLESDVPFFFKQWGGITPKTGGRTFDGRTWDEIPSRDLNDNR